MKACVALEGLQKLRTFKEIGGLRDTCAFAQDEKRWPLPELGFIGRR
jgi:hypothetical protein